jgi:hypothetical protein
LPTYSEFIKEDRKRLGVTLEVIEELIQNGTHYSICDDTATVYRYQGTEKECDLENLGLTIVLSNVSGYILSIFFSNSLF